MEKPTCDSLIAFAEWFFAGFSYVMGITIDADDRSEVYNVSIFHHLWMDPVLSSLVGPKGLGRGRSGG
jgi:hypothetical protein